MAQADVFALVDDIAGTRSDASANLADATARARFYADIVYESGLNRETVVDAALQDATRSDAEYVQPTAAIRLLALFANAKQLRMTGRKALEASDPDWRSREGMPESYTTVDQDAHTFRLVPVPDFTSSIGVATPFTNAPIPTGALMFLYTANATDVESEDELWVALDILGREFGRESDHFDRTFADVAHKLATIFRQLVGHDA